jgi:hypothetical protein
MRPLIPSESCKALMRAARCQLYQSVSQRSRQCRRMILGPLFWGWFKAKTQEEHEWLYPTGPSEASIAGTDPARILVIGDGPAAGFGVRTHQLGGAGHLARHVVGHLERGVVVTVAAEPAASARSTLKRLDDMGVEGYDCIVLMLAATDASCLTTRRSWRRNMTGLVQVLESAEASSVFVTSAASLHLERPLAPFPRRLTGRRPRTLNVETRRLCAPTNTPLIPLDAASELTSRTTARWGRRIGTHVADSLHQGTQHPPFRPHQRELPRRVQLTGKAAA